MLVFSRLV
uniref:Uncharacterized protein n=1 Tax=Anguilla anguilla TaxID=7936 RepID=A0A0E9PCP5_ANGAN